MKHVCVRFVCLLLCLGIVFSCIPLNISASSGITGVVPTDEYTFFDFEDFESMCQDAEVFEESITCVYTGFVDFQMEADIKIPKTVTLRTDGAGIVIPKDVTVILEGTIESSNLQVSGKLCNYGRLELSGGDDPAMTIAGPDCYQDRDGEKAGAIYIEAADDAMPENCISGIELNCFTYKKVMDNAKKTSSKVVAEGSEIIIDALSKAKEAVSTK